MSGRQSKRLRRLAAVRATDKRGPRYINGTLRHPTRSARALYQRLKRARARGEILIDGRPLT